MDKKRNTGGKKTRSRTIISATEKSFVSPRGKVKGVVVVDGLMNRQPEPEAPPPLRSAGDPLMPLRSLRELLAEATSALQDNWWNSDNETKPIARALRSRMRSIRNYLESGHTEAALREAIELGWLWHKLAGYNTNGLADGAARLAGFKSREQQLQAYAEWKAEFNRLRPKHTSNNATYATIAEQTTFKNLNHPEGKFLVRQILNGVNSKTEEP